MQREQLVEDLALIQKYFPGATSTELKTPFDMTARGKISISNKRVDPDSFRAVNSPGRWSGNRSSI